MDWLVTADDNQSRRDRVHPFLLEGYFCTWKGLFPVTLYWHYTYLQQVLLEVPASSWNWQAGNTAYWTKKGKVNLFPNRLQASRFSQGHFRNRNGRDKSADSAVEKIKESPLWDMWTRSINWVCGRQFACLSGIVFSQNQFSTRNLLKRKILVNLRTNMQSVFKNILFTSWNPSLDFFKWLLTMWLCVLFLPFEIMDILIHLSRHNCFS